MGVPGCLESGFQSFNASPQAGIQREIRSEPLFHLPRPHPTCWQVRVAVYLLILELMRLVIASGKQVADSGSIWQHIPTWEGQSTIPSVRIYICELHIGNTPKQLDSNSCKRNKWEPDAYGQGRLEHVTSLQHKPRQLSLAPNGSTMFLAIRLC